MLEKFLRKYLINIEKYGQREAVRLAGEAMKPDQADEISYGWMAFPAYEWIGGADLAAAIYCFLNSRGFEVRVCATSGTHGELYFRKGPLGREMDCTIISSEEGIKLNVYPALHGPVS